MKYTYLLISYLLLVGTLATVAAMDFPQKEEQLSEQQKMLPNALDNLRISLENLAEALKKSETKEQPRIIIEDKFPLIAAVKNGNIQEVIALLKQKDINISAVNEKKRNALFYALLASHFDIAELLLTAGADPNWVSDAGSPLLLLMCAADNKDAVHFLLDYGADKSTKTVDLAKQLNKTNSKDIIALLERPTFKEWNDKCFKYLPLHETIGTIAGWISDDPKGYYSEASAELFIKNYGGDFSEDEKLYIKNKKNVLSVDELLRVFADFLAMTKKSDFIKKEKWLGQNMLQHVPAQDITTGGNIELFEPFVERRVYPADTKFIIQGDRHGDVHSVLHFMHELQLKNYMFKDSFKLAHKNIRIMFLGDTVDRGVYSIEVVYTLMRLKLANPDQVILLHGNHEDWYGAMKYGLARELGLFVQDKNTQETIKHAFINYFNLLPVALYVGCGAGVTNYLQCCHGGIEIGYNPKNLLASQQMYERVDIKEDDRKKNIDASGLQKFGVGIKAKDPNCLISLDDVERIGFKDLTPHAFYFKDKSWKYSFSSSEFGFIWSDFLEKDKPEKNLSFNRGRGPMYGKRPTQIYLSFISSTQHKVQGFLRAHQHSDVTVNEMIGIILNAEDQNPYNVGVAKVWEQQTEQNKHSLWPGIVCTFNIAPNTNIGSKLGYFKAYGTKKNVTKDFYGLLTVQQKFDDWRLIMHQINHDQKM